jgi:hypothetical protein
MKLVGTLNPNTDILPSGSTLPAAEWGFSNATVPVTYGTGDSRQISVNIKHGEWNPDHDCIGVLPKFPGAPTTPTYAYTCYLENTPAPGAVTLNLSFEVPLSLSAVPASEWTGFKIYTSKSDGSVQKNVLPGQYEFVLDRGRNTAIGEFIADPDRRIYTKGECRYPEGGVTASGATVAVGESRAATAKYSPVYTQATGSGKIIRPTCSGTGGVLIWVSSDLQTKNTSNTWITTIPKLYETQYTNPATADEDTPACTTGANANCVLLPADITSTTAPATTTITYPNTTDPTSTTGTENTIGCSVSLNIASTAACLFEWAFIPTSLETNVAQMKTAVANSPIGTVSTAIDMFRQPYDLIMAEVETSPDCMGPPFPLPFIQEDLIVYPLQACSGPAAYASTWVLAITRLVIIISGLYIIVQMVLRAFGSEQQIFDNVDDINRRSSDAQRRADSDYNRDMKRIKDQDYLKRRAREQEYLKRKGKR